MATFTYAASYGATVTQAPSVRYIRFGDGYEQRASFGDADAIIAFLEARAGVDAFDWTPPSGSAGKWICRSWSRSISSNGANDISARFEEVFES